MDLKKLCFVVNDLHFFLSHRLDLAIQLSKNYQIHLICNKDNAASKDLEIISYYQMITIHHLPSRNKHEFGKGYISYFSQLKRMIDRMKPNYILFVTLEISFIGALLHYFNNSRKSLFLITGLGPFFSKNSLKYKLIKYIQKKVFSFLKYTKNYIFIFQNPDDQKTFVDLGFIKQSSSTLIRGNGINPKNFSYRKRTFDKKLVFLFASRLVKSKGIHEFIHAASIIKKKYGSAEFLIAGKYNNLDPDTIGVSEYKNLLSNKALKYLGDLHFKEMEECFHQSSIFVMPSYGEGLPKVALEAAATGMPLIMSDVQGCRECVIPNVNGFLFNPKDPDDLLKTIESCILNNNQFIKFGKNSSKMIEDKFSLEVIYEEYQKLLK